MSRSTHPQTNFTGGEWSPRADARIDIDKYNNSANIIQNFLINQVGGAFFRPGTVFANTAANSAAGKICLQSFIYSSSQAYIIEAGNQYFRFYINGGLLTSSGSPVSLTTPYAIADVFSLRGAQQADVKYFVSSLGTYAPQKLTRLSGTSFVLNQVNLIGGPFQSNNNSATTVTVSSDTNALTSSINPWAASTSYIAGNFVSNSGNNYYCLKSNTSGSSFASDLAAGFWAQCNVGAGAIGQAYVPFISTVANNFTPSNLGLTQSGPTSAGNGVYLGPYVTNSGSTYECVVPHISGSSFATDLAAGKWTLVATASIPAWGTTNYYVPNTLVTNGGNSYYCLLANTAGASFATDLAAGKWKLLSAAPAWVGSSTVSTINLTVQIPAWTATTQYTQGAFVTNSGSTYICVLPNTSSSTFATDLASGMWKLQNFFQSGHVGSLFGVSPVTSAGGTFVITTFVSATQVQGYIQNTPSGMQGCLCTNGNATTNWAFGAFSNVNGWPTSLVFYEQRLYYGMGNEFYGSSIGAFDDFSAGSQLATDSVDYQLLEDLLNNIGWLQGSTFAMKAGTSDGSFFISSGTQNQPISPTNILAQKQTTWGSAVINPARLYDAIYYASSDLNQLRELRWYLDIESDRSVDMTLMADHMFQSGGGIVMINDQSYPQGRLWVPRGDGQLPVLTRNIEQEVTGWCRFIMGNTSGGPGVVESLEIIPTPSGPSQIWVSVLRVIAGVQTRCIEYFSPETYTNPWDPIRMDCSLTYNVPITITGISVGLAPAYQITVTAPSHGLSNGQQVKIDNVVGLTQLNGNFYKVANVTTNTFTLVDLTLQANTVSGFGFGTYLSGGQVRLMVTTVSGLSYLNGENVVVTCDGGLPGSQQVFTVSGGSITLPTPAAVVNVGLPYQGMIQLQKFAGTAQGKMTRIYLATIRVVSSLGLQVGTDLTKLATYKFAIPNNPVGHAPALFTGDLEIGWQTGWSKTDQVYLVQNAPLPLFISGGFFRTESEELD